MEKHKCHWVRVDSNPWFSTFGIEVVLRCSICHRFVNISEKEAGNFESKTRLHDGGDNNQ